MIFGRHLEILESIKFLTKPGDLRILNINGVHGVGCGTIARYSIKYVMNRHFLEDGAFYVDVNNKFSAQGILTAISKTLGLLTNEKQEIVEVLHRFCKGKILLLIDECTQIIENDYQNF